MHATLSTTKRKRKARNGVCTSGLLANPVFFFKSHCGVFLKKRGEREDEKVKRAQSNRGRCLPSEVAQEGENMRWIVDILIGDDFVKLWAEPHEISKITAQLCIAIGRGHILVPKDSRFSLLSTWMEAHSAWMTRSCRSVDKKLVKDGQFSPFHCLNNRSLWIRRLCNMKQWTSTEKDVWDHSICRAEIDSPIQPLGIGLADAFSLYLKREAPWVLLLFPDIRLEIRDYCSLILLLYVDEMLITCSTPTLVSNFILLLNLRLICHFLGMEITPTTNGLHLSQSHYAVTILEPSNMVDCKPMGTPLRQK
ncbi:hypothetical protein SADUNF_Sadunf15G0040500 [Salix dunnii]|uniref:Reverse transcriptase domain-containing protein n=1 Tax=Salix dunnii TaxID=1413687 RepID=A0A835JI59_9ROSI|nr:hypothetical protein SADUNF_Sadunf15G0040500 [Salix dunnii]